MNARSLFIRTCVGIVEWGLRLTVLAVPIYFAWFKETYAVFDLNKVVAFRLLVGVVVVAWLGKASLEGSYRRLNDSRIIWPLLAVAAAYVAAAIAAVNPEIGVWGVYGRQQGLYTLFHYVLFCLILLSSITDRRSLYRLFSWFLMGAALACVYGLMQAAGLDPYAWTDVSSRRIFSSFGQTNFFGHYLVVAIPLTAHLLFDAARKKWQRAALGALLGLEFVCLVLTYSRGAWIALALAGLAWGLVRLLRRRRYGLAVGIVSICLAGAAVLIAPPIRSAILSAVDPERSNFFVYRAASILDFESNTIKVRRQYWEPTVRGLLFETSLKHQLFGYGPDNEDFFFARYYRPEWAYYETINTYPDRAHNVIFDLILQFGLIGFLAFAWLSAVVAYRLIRYVLREPAGPDQRFALALLAALVAYGANNLFSFSVTAMSLTFFMLLAGAWLVVTSYRGRTASLPWLSPFSRYLLAAALAAVIAVVWHAHSLRPFLADHYYRAIKLSGQRSCAAILADSEAVIERYPASSFYLQEYVSHYAHCLPEIPEGPARQAALEAMTETIDRIERLPQPLHYYQGVAYGYIALAQQVDPSYYERAEARYLELLAINPWITTTYQNFGMMRLEQGRFDEAVDLFSRGIAALPSLDEALVINYRYAEIARAHGIFRELIGQAYFTQGRHDEALPWYREAVMINPELASAQKKIADIAYLHGEIEEASRLMEEGRETWPEDYTWPFGLAILYKEQGDMEEARRLALEAAALAPDNGEVRAFVDSL